MHCSKRIFSNRQPTARCTKNALSLHTVYDAGVCPCRPFVVEGLLLAAVPLVIAMVVIMVNVRLGQGEMGEQGAMDGELGRHLLLAEAAFMFRVEG